MPRESSVFTDDGEDNSNSRRVALVVDALRVGFDRLLRGLVGAGLRVPGEAAFGLVAVLGVANVDAPVVETDGVDGAARLDEQVDRVRDLVLVAVRGLDEVIRVEDRGRAGVDIRSLVRDTLDVSVSLNGVLVIEAGGTLYWTVTKDEDLTVELRFRTSTQRHVARLYSRGTLGEKASLVSC